MQYVTVQDVDDALGSDWASEDEKARYIAMANAYITSHRVSITEPVPDDVVLAGVELAKAASSDELYSQKTEGLLTKKRVKADTVESEKQYADVSYFGAYAGLPSGVQFALAILDQYKAVAMSITVGHKHGYA